MLRSVNNTKAAPGPTHGYHITCVFQRTIQRITFCGCSRLPMSRWRFPCSLICLTTGFVALFFPGIPSGAQFTHTLFWWFPLPPAWQPAPEIFTGATQAVPYSPPTLLTQSTPLLGRQRLARLAGPLQTLFVLHPAECRVRFGFVKLRAAALRAGGGRRPLVYQDQTYGQRR
jgi:hypothetical protein